MHYLVDAVADMVPELIRSRELRQRGVDDGELIGAGVRGGVARPQDPRECLAGGVEETEHRMEPKPTFEMRRRALLVLGVDLHEDASTSSTICGAAPRALHAFARAPARAARNPSSTLLSIASKLRQIVAADATSPKIAG